MKTRPIHTYCVPHKPILTVRIYLFIWKSVTGREGETENLLPRKPKQVSRSQEPEFHPSLPQGHLPLPSQELDWKFSSWTWTGAYLRCQHCRPQLNLLCHRAGPSQHFLKRPRQSRIFKKKKTTIKYVSG